jgi:anti-sigma28 factor (negative regulator of flagellin synthesis)
MNNATFNAARVAHFREMIRNGQFRVDAARVADRLIFEARAKRPPTPDSKRS